MKRKHFFEHFANLEHSTQTQTERGRARDSSVAAQVLQIRAPRICSCSGRSSRCTVLAAPKRTARRPQPCRSPVLESGHILTRSAQQQAEKARREREVHGDSEDGTFERRAAALGSAATATLAADEVGESGGSDEDDVGRRLGRGGARHGLSACSRVWVVLRKFKNGSLKMHARAPGAPPHERSRGHPT